jgi:two-component system, OmpR family, alkaline phosphatase synthesis response regulator PhoP
MTVTQPRGSRAAPYILVLEDLDDIANLLRGELSARGYRCFSLRSRSSAERFLNRVRPDLVIVDYELLGGTGVNAANMAANAGVPVIVMSGYLTVRDEIEGLGFNYVQKPFSMLDMVELVSRLLTREPSSGCK